MSKSEFSTPPSLHSSGRIYANAPPDGTKPTPLIDAPGPFVGSGEEEGVQSALEAGAGDVGCQSRSDAAASIGRGVEIPATSAMPLSGWVRLPAPTASPFNRARKICRCQIVLETVVLPQPWLQGHLRLPKARFWTVTKVLHVGDGRVVGQPFHFEARHRRRVSNRFGRADHQRRAPSKVKPMALQSLRQ